MIGWLGVLAGQGSGRPHPVGALLTLAAGAAIVGWVWLRNKRQH